MKMILWACLILIPASAISATASTWTCKNVDEIAQLAYDGSDVTTHHSTGKCKWSINKATFDAETLRFSNEMAQTGSRNLRDGSVNNVSSYIAQFFPNFARIVASIDPSNSFEDGNWPTDPGLSCIQTADPSSAQDGSLTSFGGAVLSCISIASQIVGATVTFADLDFVASRPYIIISLDGLANGDSVRFFFPVE